MIAVISDSHIPRRAERLPQRFLEIVEEADKAVHCGDFVSEQFYKDLKSRNNNFTAVKGNCDRFQLPNSESFELKNVSFGVYHGTGIHPRGHLPTLVETARKLNAKVLLTGHTHEQEAVKKEGKIILNPGSCTGVSGGSYSGGNPEMMTVEVHGEKIEARKLEKKEKLREETVPFQL